MGPAATYSHDIYASLGNHNDIGRIVDVKKIPYATYHNRRIYALFLGTPCIQNAIIAGGSTYQLALWTMQDSPRLFSI